ncbi:MAG: 2,3-bisphosphoglycerate-dependent phosphoglycerate mutase [Patescibacteria group bacterium]|jgi:2,3-bisphosphoglycerate-dependent phosphoglycerate mutase
MFKIVLLRHGESTWNKKGLFTGWTDVNLSPRGRQESQEAGKTLKAKKFIFNYAFTSELKRAQKTLDLVLREMKLKGLVIKKDWRLNERHYGELQGKNKETIRKKYGDKQFNLWRRGYQATPPGGESLQDVEKRVKAVWRGKIVPAIKRGRLIIIASSGNTLRALVKYLDKLSVTQVGELNIPYGIPLVYEFNERLKPTRHYYLGDNKKIKAVMAEVKKQGR